MVAAHNDVTGLFCLLLENVASRGGGTSVDWLLHILGDCDRPWSGIKGWENFSTPGSNPGLLHFLSQLPTLGAGAGAGLT